MEELVRKRIGLIRIEQSMKTRGFAPDLIQRMVDTHRLLNREVEIAKAAAEKKMAALTRETDRRKKREKVVRFLRSRGFRPSTISAVLDGITAGDVG
jgi:SOS response regulatory protein OraA/RecX